MAAKISFSTRAGDKIEGEIVDYNVGKCMLIRVTKANRKNLRNKTTLFPKDDMGNLRITSSDSSVKIEGGNFAGDITITGVKAR